MNNIKIVNKEKENIALNENDENDILNKIKSEKNIYTSSKNPKLYNSII